MLWSEKLSDDPASTSSAVDLSFPSGLSSTIIWSNLHPGCRARRTIASSARRPIARFSSVFSAPRYLDIHVSRRFLPSQTRLSRWKRSYLQLIPSFLIVVKTRIPRRFGLNPICDIQVLCPMNRGGVGARSLKIELQAALNPAGDQKIERFGWTFAPGDKVMQIENDYDKAVYNGDIGYIDAVDTDAGELTASFDGHSVTYGFGELDALVPAYAASIHKSQGSEYPAVVIPVMTQHYPMLQRNLLYTGVTRGKKLVILVGQKKAVAIAIRNVSGRRRWSKLSEWLASRQSTGIDKKENQR
jgi:UvrD-like helicase C-terminal domain/ATP-dependent RecD-like DNA helicase SH3 domain